MEEKNNFIFSLLISFFISFLFDTLLTNSGNSDGTGERKAIGRPARLYQRPSLPIFSFYFFLSLFCDECVFGFG
jgi:hypothetical protein